MSRFARPDATLAWREKAVALAILVVPVVVLVAVAVAELVEGDLSGAQYLVHAGAVVALGALAWILPRTAGWLLIALAVLIVTTFVVLDQPDMAAAAVAAVALVLFVAPVLAGVLLIFASRAPAEAP